jgi:hypothetical protein
VVLNENANLKRDIDKLKGDLKQAITTADGFAKGKTDYVISSDFEHPISSEIPPRLASPKQEKVPCQFALQGCAVPFLLRVQSLRAVRSTVDTAVLSKAQELSKPWLEH